jgi:hypothetical protein
VDAFNTSSTKRLEHPQHLGVSTEKQSVLSNAVAIELRNTLELTTRAGSIFVDRAPVVFPEELATPVDVRQHPLDDDRAVILPPHWHVDRKRREPPHFVAAEQRRELVAVLLTASGGAQLAGAVAEDG